MQQFLQQVFVGKVGLFSRVSEVFTAGNLRIGIGFNHVNGSRLIHSHVDTRIPTQSQRAIDTFREMLDIVDHAVRQIPRLT